MSSVDKQKVIENAVKIIAKSEGRYNSVVRNDNGACSIGIMQWHADRALNLLRDMIKTNGKLDAITSIGPLLVAEITKTKTTWAKRKLGNIEKELLSKYISSDKNVVIQDVTANKDIRVYVDKVVGLGVTNVGAIIYLADALHQYGINSKLWLDLINEVKANVSGEMVVDDIHRVAINNKTLRKYINRRANTFKAIIALPISRYSIKL